jgi:Asp-tRNA(Asn)/Glu-tRNA(Gln) amidotransferase A subunit family amidase
MQIVGRPFSEPLLLGLARALEPKARWARPPGVVARPRGGS